MDICVYLGNFEIHFFSHPYIKVHVNIYIFKDIHARAQELSLMKRRSTQECWHAHGFYLVIAT